MKVLILFFAFLIGPDQAANTKDIGIALSAGSAKELVKFCNATVEIKINGESSNYSKNQAEAILRKFFQNNPPSEFNYIHQGSTQESIEYSIGRYTTVNAKSFRVVIFIKKQGDNYLIDTLNFSEE